MQTTVQISEFLHDEQMPKSEQQSSVLQKSICTQRNNLQSEIYNENNAQELSNKDNFKCIVSGSHFSLYLDIFNDGNFSPLGINGISEIKEDDLNELPLNFYQNKETIIDHSFATNEHEIFVPPCFGILDEMEGNSRQSCEVIYDDYSDIEDVDFYTSQENPHEKIQITPENEEHFNLGIISTNLHFRAANYLHDFTIQEIIPIYDSYEDQTPIPIHNHNSFSISQVGIQNYPNSIILAIPCENEIISKRFQLCCNISCTNSDFILVFLSHLVCLNLDLFSDFIFQNFNTLCCHIEHFIIKHSIDEFPYWEIEVSCYNHEHQKLLTCQCQLMFISYQNLLSSQRRYQQENVFLEICQQSNLINNFPIHLKDFHPFFINSFEKYLENFLSKEIVNSLTFVHNTNNFFQALKAHIHNLVCYLFF